MLSTKKLESLSDLNKFQDIFFQTSTFSVIRNVMLAKSVSSKQNICIKKKKKSFHRMLILGVSSPVILKVSTLSAQL